MLASVRIYLLIIHLRLGAGYLLGYPEIAALILCWMGLRFYPCKLRLGV